MRILIGFDGSSQAMAGARWVAGLRLGARDEVIVATVIREPAMLRVHTFLHPADGFDQAAWRDSEEEVRPFVEEALSIVRTQGCSVRSVIRQGRPTETLVALAEEREADLVVVGSSGRSPIESLVLGSVTQELLQAMPTALLVARPSVPEPSHVLLATDGSSHSISAASYLAQLPLPDDVSIGVMTACCDVPHEDSDEREQAVESVDAAAAILDTAGWRTTSHIRVGEPRAAILAAIDELGIDLLVTGARGLGSLSSLLLGSISRSMAQTAPCSVLVVPDGVGRT